MLLVGEGEGRISNLKKGKERERGKEGRDNLFFFSSGPTRTTKESESAGHQVVEIIL